MTMVWIGLNDEQVRVLEVAWEESVLRDFGERISCCWFIAVMSTQGRFINCLCSR